MPERLVVFPSLAGQPACEINLNSIAIQWLRQHPSEPIPEKGLSAQTHLQMIIQAQREHGVAYSYGGWMEDRSTLLKGTYLDEEKKYMHVGVDINAPEGTPVAVSREGTVIHIDDDHPEEGGWGPRVIIQVKDSPIALIYTHLDPEILCKVGDILRPGTVFAKIGPPSHNGGWFSHLHVQALSQEALAMFKKDPGSIDG
jgi:murein DD-endopeptidase MepM/ murein hydrolase activator NlpD